jgi:tetratricopeptide (TPR) repeat protein
VLRLLCRILFIAYCGFAAWRSVRIAVADWVASAGTVDALERATRFAPDDPRLLARMAIARSDNGDPSPDVDEGLRRAAQASPLDSGVLMALGLREEFRGNNAKAEGYLVRAAEIDHQFKPAWTLANYYFRNDQSNKGWPMIQRILNLEPLGFDTAPVFELCWRQSANDQKGTAGKIFSLIPKRGHRPVQYLAFLIGTKRTDTALDVWPEALAAADAADASDVATLTRFVDFLGGSDRMREAVTVWNRLVDRGMIHSGRLDPAQGISIADPDFQFPPMAMAFDWLLAEVPGVSVSGFTGSGLTGSLRFEIDGDEPQSFQILSVFAPVLSASRYRLDWKSDGSALNAPQDPGFSFQIVQQPGDVVTQCPPLLASGKSSACDFVTPTQTTPGRGTSEQVTSEQIKRARIDLRYTRAQGTTRVSGTLRLFTVRLELVR